MKQSKYNTILQLNSGNYILANGLTCAIDLCPKNIGTALKENRQDDISESDRKALTSRGYLCSEDDEQQKLGDLAALIQMFSAKDKSYTLILSYNCNFRCSYCFEKWRLQNGNDWLNAIMDNEVMDNFLKELEQQDKSVPHRITLYGGEPLMSENRQCIERLIAGLAGSSAKIDMIITNGYTVDEYLPLLKKMPDVKLQITLDGSPEIHNSRRFLKGGEGTFEKIADNISLALAEGINISLRVNIDKSNEESVNGIRREAQVRGWDRAENLHLYYSLVNDTTAELPDDVEFHTEEKIRSRLEKAIENRGHIRPMLYYCGAYCGINVVDPFGAVYPCWEVCGMQEHICGHLTEEGIVAIKESFFRGRKVTDLENCKTCPRIFFCGGGCPMRSFVSDSPKNGNCGKFKTKFEDSMIQFGTERELRNEIIDELIPLTQDYNKVLELIGEKERVILARKKLPLALYGHFRKLQEEL